MNILEKLVLTRKEIGLSQKEVAQLAGCSVATVNRAESETGEDISLGAIMKIAGAMDLSLVLVSREEEFESEIRELERKKAEISAMLDGRKKLLEDYRAKSGKR